MLQHLPAFDACLWLITAFLHVVAAFVVLRSGLHRTYAAFSVYTYFAAALNICLLVLPAKFYFLGYTIGSIARSLLLAAVLFELYTRVCGPNFSLPVWVPRTMATWLAVAVSTSLAATRGLYTVRLLPKRAALLAAGLGGMLMTLFLALVVLLLYSKYLGMEWKMRPRQIVIGLALYLSVNTVVLFLLNHVPAEAMRLLDRTGQFALLLSLVWWTFALRRREPEPEPVTQEMMETILAFHRE